MSNLDQNPTSIKSDNTPKEVIATVRFNKISLVFYETNYIHTGTKSTNSKTS
jgi:hypothetical protein